MLCWTLSFAGLRELFFGRWISLSMGAFLRRGIQEREVIEGLCNACNGVVEACMPGVQLCKASVRLYNDCSEVVEAYGHWILHKNFQGSSSVLLPEHPETCIGAQQHIWPTDVRPLPAIALKAVAAQHRRAATGTRSSLFAHGASSR